MRKRFDRELKELNQELLQMGMYAESAIEKSIDLISRIDEKAAREVFDYEAEIDKMEYQIQTLCIKLILEQQPVAGDLRFISSALKIITDLERIGDQAKDIAEICLVMDHRENGEILETAKKMSIAARKMLNNTINSFVNNDLELAKSIQKADDVVDNYFVEIRDKLIEELKNTEIGNAQIIDLIMMAKYLERIADHSVNISRWVIYSIEG